jgi:arylsulfatase A-like enzyme
MTPSARPDILWIVTTQWRAQALGHAGDPNARTPSLDALARQSLRHTQAVTPHPFGPFARAALLTGVASPGNGVRDYFDPLPTQARTIAHGLRELGYATAYFGKWHLSARDPRMPLIGEAQARLVVPPEARGGFEFWEGFEGGFLLNDPWLHGSRIERPQRVPGYQSDVLCGRAAAWLGDRYAEDSSAASGDDRAWFAVVSLEAPHPPYDAAAAGIAAQDPEGIVLAPNVPRGGAVELQARKELSGYYAHIEATDRAIGALILALDRDSARRGRRAPIVVFTSVHGDMHGAHGLFRKGWPHEESVRVPLLVRIPPAALAAGGAAVSDQPVSLLDLPAMTLAWAGGEPAPPGKHWSRMSMPSVVRLPHQCDRIWRGVRTRSRKLVLDDHGAPWMYFDLDRDPWEQSNLTADPARGKEMEALRRMAGL